MSLLGNTSVRTILATVFVVLALALCGSLGWQLYSAWDLSGSAERVMRSSRIGVSVSRSSTLKMLL